MFGDSKDDFKLANFFLEFAIATKAGYPNESHSFCSNSQKSPPWAQKNTYGLPLADLIPYYFMILILLLTYLCNFVFDLQKSHIYEEEKQLHRFRFYQYKIHEIAHGQLAARHLEKYLTFLIFLVRRRLCCLLLDLPINILIFLMYYYMNTS